MKKRFQFAGTALGLMMLASSGVAMAQESSPPAEGPMLFPAGCNVIAEGLNQPRYLTVAADGTVYVTEAGDGGEEVVSAPPAAPGAGTPVVGEGEGDEGPPITRGTSGQVTAIAPDGTKTVVASGLPSYGGVGPVGIVENDGILTISVGGAAVDTGTMLGIDIEEMTYENSLVLIDPSTGNVAPIAQLSHFEVDQNPDGTDINPNLYQLAVGPGGMLYVTDAGGNTIYKVDPATGAGELVTVIPPLSELMGGTPGADPATDRQPVPVGIGFDAEGVMYVSLLSEGWPGPNIVRVEADGTVTPIASGLGMTFGFANAPDGTLYVVEGTAGFDETGMPLPGRVLRLDGDGTLTPVVEELFLPIGADVDADGNVFVTVNSIAFGPGEPSGMIVRCDGAAAS
jgi:sugar lactone lactonase YvrE